jgi:ATP-dependent helicase HrpB
LPELPIEPLIPSVRSTLDAHRAVVLQAPPGAGKTTRIPLALVDAHWLRRQSIVMLEPRRLATRAAAHRLAQQLGESVGETVGYRMRGDTRVGPRTRIEVVTEGVLTRRLQRDPTLEHVGLLIFDEFHERSLDADLGLALALRTQSLVRDDLRLLVMSATLDGTAVAALLDDAPVLTSEGRAFPVETRYVEPRRDARLEATVASTVGEAIRRDAGDVLVFLPGAREIHRVAAALADRRLDTVVVHTLFGAMPHDAQDRAILPDPRGRRKVVLATSIAETSLTIEGVRVVVDAGWSRVPRFSPRSGMTRLDTVRVSRASADQRRGRAGRVAPGVCYRLWSEHEDAQLLARTPPEIANADLAPLALDLAAAGVSDPEELRWLDAPSPAAFAHATELLQELDALDARGAVTDRGRAMHALPVHPRLSHMLLGARDRGGVRTACELAAVLSERDVLRGIGGPIDADIALRVDLVRRDAAAVVPAGAEVDRDALRRARDEAERLARQLRADAKDDAGASIGLLAALAYPDRVAQRRPGTRARYVLRNGRGGELTGAQTLSESPYIVALELDDQRPESRIFLAAAVELSEIREAFGGQIVVDDVVEFDADAVVARRRERLGAIVLRESTTPDADPEAITRALVAEVRRRGVGGLPWSEAAARLRARMAFAAAHVDGWPDVSDEALAASLDDWLTPALADARRWSDVQRANLGDALSSLLDWKQRKALDDLAPTHIEVPTGSRIPVDYSDPRAPVLAVRLQEVFGVTESPRIAGGRVAVTMHLLSPAHRPVQVTRDLAGFWKTSYFDVRKDMRGRYPKHEWPEDPLSATPTKRAKRRGSD